MKRKDRNFLECIQMLACLSQAARESEDSTLLVGIKKDSFDFVIKKACKMLMRYQDNENND